MTAQPIYSALLAEDPDLVGVVARFIDTLPAQIARLRRAQAAGDLVGVHETCHDLKGAAGNLGFDPVMQVASRMEREAKAGRADAFEELLRELEQLQPRLRAQAPPASDCA